MKGTAVYLTTKAFWAGTLERAIKTFAQAGLAVLGATAVNLWTVPWEADAGIAGGAALLSVLTSLATGTTVTKTTPIVPTYVLTTGQAGTTTTAGTDPAAPQK